MAQPTAEIWCTTARGPSPQTERSCEATGWETRVVQGVSDTALARCVTATRCAMLGKSDVYLWVDDDMQFEKAAALRLVTLCAELELPVSAVYVGAGGAPTAAPIDSTDAKIPWMGRRWVTGLGMIAIPRKALLELVKSSKLVRAPGERPEEKVAAVCWSGPGEIRLHGAPWSAWISEDYCLTYRMGGAVLAPVAAGHIKAVTLTPHASVLRSIQDVGHYLGATEKTWKEGTEAS